MILGVAFVLMGAGSVLYGVAEIAAALQARSEKAAAAQREREREQREAMERAKAQ